MSDRGPYELQISVEIRQVDSTMGYGNGLRIHENLDLDARDFMELCEILAQFHKLAEQFRARRREHER
jgi:hypothetical protein